MASHPPETLVKALALGWSLAIFDGPTTLVLQGVPRIRGRILRADDWLLTLPPALTLSGFETVSLTPTACNHGMALSLPGNADAPRLRWRKGGCIPVTPKTAPRLPELPQGHRAIGLTMAPRANSLGHPFPGSLPQSWQDQRHEVENAIRRGQPLPTNLPRHLLRCVLRDLAATTPCQKVADLARLHDRPLFRARFRQGCSG